MTVWALTGCGDFWQDPYATNNNGGTTATTTTLTASPTTTTVGSAVTLTATVSASAATGTVTFYSNSTSIGSADLSSGTASTTYTPTSAGTDSLTASYSGDDTYASSTSDPVTITVSTSASAGAGVTAAVAGRPAGSGDPSGAPNPEGMHTRVATTAYEAAPIHATSAFSARDGEFTAKDAGAVVVEGKGAVTLTGAKLTAAAGNGRGVLLEQTGNNTGKPSFSMTGGSLSYTCAPDLTPACGEGSKPRGQNQPAALFSAANATAEIRIEDVTVTNNTPLAARDNGTLLTAGSFLPQSAGNANGAQVIFRAEGTTLKGDVIVDRLSTAALSILADGSGQGSTLAGAINSAGKAKTVSLTLDPASLWVVTGNSYVTSLDGLDLDGKTVRNVDGGGHCVFYSGEINGQSSATVYTLAGGGYLAPRDTPGLGCD